MAKVGVCTLPMENTSFLETTVKALEAFIPTSQSAFALAKAEA